MRMPSAKDVAADLKDVVLQINRDGMSADDYCDVRLQVNADGGHQLHSGDEQYDTDHTGFWGSSVVSVNTTPRECRNIARQLINEAWDSYYSSR